MKELINVMDDLLNVLDQLREAAYKKQRALIENNLEAIESAINDEERSLTELQAIHKKRIKMLEEVTKKLSLNVNFKKFGEFLKAAKSKIGDESYTKLLEQNNALGMLLGNVNLLNLQNRYLTEQARDFNRSLINELLVNNKKPIVDRKV